MECNNDYVETIRCLFFKQIKNLTMKSNGIETFDVQFSDAWLK